MLWKISVPLVTKIIFFHEELFSSLEPNTTKMTTIRPFRCDDLFRFNNVNLDPLTETYGLPFYLQYLAHWPEYFQVLESPSGEIMGYIMGKAEGTGEQWHGHVTALSVAPEFRRLGLAGKLMNGLEEISEKKQCYFVDLFVRVSNKVAVAMYEKLGYSVYRRVLEYYSGEVDEDAFDMRKALSRDKEKKSVVPLPHPVRPDELD
ncbi:N(alpha)-acetyltransferase 20, NatB catalytic subunit [Bulinus truncatus]|nr:N(alpha)-acetyltransferase 20, NatB catalytic subunit [Bulinus truncatus]